MVTPSCSWQLSALSAANRAHRGQDDGGAVSPWGVIGLLHPQEDEAGGKGPHWEPGALARPTRGAGAGLKLVLEENRWPRSC